ncbi:hypothetical protein ACNHYB_07425 [Isoptericola jiangsuensis]|uniref:hypothetical protein n=1 Tax=Isoptericola jiangsuensis TaxID=548579 RepID=UPI003AABE324
MMGRRAWGRAIFFGLGYLAGTRAGRQRYAQIEAVARAVASTIRDHVGQEGTDTPGPARSGRTSSRRTDPYADITLGRP